MFTPKEILKDALTLKPAEKAELVNKLLSSLDKPDRDIKGLIQFACVDTEVWL